MNCGRSPQVRCPCSECQTYRKLHKKPVPVCKLLRLVEITLLEVAGVEQHNDVQFNDCVNYDWPDKYIGQKFSVVLPDCTAPMLKSVLQRHCPNL